MRVHIGAQLAPISLCTNDMFGEPTANQLVHCRYRLGTGETKQRFRRLTGTKEGPTVEVRGVFEAGYFALLLQRRVSSFSVHPYTRAI